MTLFIIHIIPILTKYCRGASISKASASGWLSAYSVFASHVVGHGVAPDRVIPKTTIKYTNCISTCHEGRSLAVQLDCENGGVGCGTVYWDMHYNELLGSIPRVSIPVLDFYLVRNGLRCRKKSDGFINQSISNSQVLNSYVTELDSQPDVIAFLLRAAHCMPRRCRDSTSSREARFR